MILIALGSNLSHSQYGPPASVLKAALALLPRHGVGVVDLSRLYMTRPYGPGIQRAYANAVALVETKLTPEELLAALHGVEQSLGRRRARRWGARRIDLDLLDYQGLKSQWRRLPPALGRRLEGLILPHPRLHKRQFMLAPLADVAPFWRHPGLGKPVKQLLKGIKSQKSILSIRPFL